MHKVNSSFSAQSRLRQAGSGLALFFFLLTLQPGWAQQCQWWEQPINCANRKSMAQLWGEAAGAKMDMSQQIATARARFWQTYPNKPGFAEASANFAALLNDKDIYYLNTYISAQRLNLPHQPAMDQTVAGMDVIYGGVKVDDGIPESAEFAFREWSISFKENLDAAGGLLSLNVVDNMIKAMAASEKKHRKYLLARDWAEFDAAGRIPAGFDQPDKYATLLYVRFGQMTLDEAEENVRVMRRLFGDDVVLHAAREVLTAPKTRNGHLVNHAPDVPAIRDEYGHSIPDRSFPQPPQVSGIYSSQLEAFELIGARSDDRRYALAVLADAKPRRGTESRYLGKWTFAEKAYGRFVDAYGATAVKQAAYAVRTATKQLYDGEVMHPEAIGAVHHNLYKAFQDVLAKKDPAGAVKLILAFDPGGSSREELNVEYAKLVAQYSEPKIFVAMQKLASTDPDPMYGERKYLLGELEGKPNCDPTGLARGGKGAAIGSAIGRPGCPTEATDTSSPRNPQAQPYVPNPELPHYELTETSARQRISTYCRDIYNPPQPLLSQEQIKRYYANTAAVDAEVKRCESWFDAKEVMVGRKEAMRYCLVNYDFMGRGGSISRKQYDACMNKYDTVSALCTVEFRNRIELNRKKGFGTDSQDNLCQADAPRDAREYNVVKFGGSEDIGHFKVPESGPELPAVLKSPLAAGLLHELGSTEATVIPSSPSGVAPVPAPAPPALQGSPAVSVPSRSGAAAADAGPGGGLKPVQRTPSLPFGLPNVRRLPNMPGNAGHGGGSAQAELMNRLSADSRRSSQARTALQKMQAGNVTLPQDVMAARGRLDGELRQAATTTVQNPGAAEPALAQLEGTLSLLEAFLTSRQQP